MRRHIFSLALATLVALGGAACATANTDAIEAARTARLEQGAGSLLQVDSHHWSDVVVYAVLSDGYRTRLGVVPAAGSTNFVLPAWMLETGGTLQLICDPIGARTPQVMERLTVLPGQMISWTLESDLDRSSLAVW